MNKINYLLYGYLRFKNWFNYLFRKYTRYHKHSYDFRFRAGVHNYYQCSQCGKRKVAHNSNYKGYSAINYSWLKTKQEEE